MCYGKIIHGYRGVFLIYSRKDNCMVALKVFLIWKHFSDVQAFSATDGGAVVKLDVGWDIELLVRC